ncbi:SET domain-containing protein 4 [Heterocephalus glaber]|uniref:SET domain-containing protein 4 n=1 Tax=Heterocephalus glaber TaxID=10181 RepID=G5AM14_HETGA|nr:SET domain-containing protein 4 [Heterocephalus glaber]
MNRPDLQGAERLLFAGRWDFTLRARAWITQSTVPVCPPTATAILEAVARGEENAEDFRDRGLPLPGQLPRNYICSMQKRRGRTSRIRRRKLIRGSESRGANESHKPEFIELKKWLKDRNFEDTNLTPAQFPAMRSFDIMKEFGFLGREERGDVGVESCFLARVVGLSSGTCEDRVSESPQQRGFLNDEGCFLTEEAIDRVFSYSALLWAWCTVNTRAVYLRTRRRDCLSPEPDTCALAPYLDLLNHSPHVQVKAAFNEETGCYEIRTASSCRKHEEVFICYGPHDNHRLLLEYGFVSLRNPHACVYVSREILVRYLPSTDKQMNRKIAILKDHGFMENLTFGWDGPSWRLLTALKLLCLEAEKFTCWTKVLLGEVISDTNEKTSLNIARKMCYYLIEETTAVLQKVSHMKDEKVSLINQLTLVETLRMEELKILKASAETLSSLQTTLT